MCGEDEEAPNAANGAVMGLNFSAPAYSCRHLMKREAFASRAISILNMLLRLSREKLRQREKGKGCMGSLHRAAYRGSIAQTVFLLTFGVVALVMSLILPPLNRNRGRDPIKTPG